MNEFGGNFHLGDIVEVIDNPDGYNERGANYKLNQNYTITHVYKWSMKDFDSNYNCLYNLDKYSWNLTDEQLVLVKSVDENLKIMKEAPKIAKHLKEINYE